jgi:hypothetical protein
MRSLWKGLRRLSGRKVEGSRTNRLRDLRKSSKQVYNKEAMNTMPPVPFAFARTGS